MTPLVTGLMPHQIAKCQTRGPRLPLLKGSPTVAKLKKPATWLCLVVARRLLEVVAPQCELHKGARRTRLLMRAAWQLADARFAFCMLGGARGGGHVAVGGIQGRTAGTRSGTLSGIGDT